MKFSWLIISGFTDLVYIKERMLDAAFVKTSDEGFIINKFTNNHIEGSYVTQKIRSYTTVDPFGEELESKILEYTIFKFHIDIERGLMRLINPPRSISPLLNGLSSISNYNIAVMDLKLNLIDWIGHYEKEIGAHSVIEARWKDNDFKNEIYKSTLIKSEDDIRLHALKSCFCDMIFDSITIRNNSDHLNKISFYSSASVSSKTDISLSSVESLEKFFHFRYVE